MTELPEDFQPRHAALLMVDLQNDFLDPEGAYGRAGLASPAIAALPGRLKPVADALRTAGGHIISTQFTLVPGRGGEPLIPEHLRRLRPFLGRGDFCPGEWGHRLVEGLQPADFVVEKVAYSGFYQSPMEFILGAMDIRWLLICGIVTNGGVASTLRDAHVRGLHTVLLEDGCAAFDDDLHQASLRVLGSISPVMSCEACIQALERASGN